MSASSNGLSPNESGIVEIFERVAKSGTEGSFKGSDASKRVYIQVIAADEPPNEVWRNKKSTFAEVDAYVQGLLKDSKRSYELKQRVITSFFEIIEKYKKTDRSPLTWIIDHVFGKYKVSLHTFFGTKTGHALQAEAKLSAEGKAIESAKQAAEAARQATEAALKAAEVAEKQAAEAALKAAEAAAKQKALEAAQKAVRDAAAKAAIAEREQIIAAAVKEGSSTQQPLKLTEGLEILNKILSKESRAEVNQWCRIDISKKPFDEVTKLKVCKYIIPEAPRLYALGKLIQNKRVQDYTREERDFMKQFQYYLKTRECLILGLCRQSRKNQNPSKIHTMILQVIANIEEECLLDDDYVTAASIISTYPERIKETQESLTEAEIRIQKARRLGNVAAVPKLTEAKNRSENNLKLYQSQLAEAPQELIKARSEVAQEYFLKEFFNYRNANNCVGVIVNEILENREKETVEQIHNIFR